MYRASRDRYSIYEYSDIVKVEIRQWKEYLDRQKATFETKLKTQEQTLNVSKTDLDFLRVLGEGAFGKVMLAKNIKNNEYYAVKIINKAHTKGDNKVKQMRNEKRILLAIQFPFIIELISYIEDKRQLLCILTLLPCGDLSDHLQQLGKFDEYLSKFYAAQVLLAIEFLHYIDVLYRDLKPENILLDTKGYIRLTDFGMCKHLQGNSRTYTFCGTPEYIAPEIILNKGYGKSVDYWSFGALLFELNAGHSPFAAKTQFKIYTKIIGCEYSSPKFFSDELTDIIYNLLQTDLSKRYGVLMNGIDDIKNHKWFESIIWLAVANKGIKAPYIPRVEEIQERKLSVKNN